MDASSRIARTDLSSLALIRCCHMRSGCLLTACRLLHSLLLPPSSSVSLSDLTTRHLYHCCHSRVSHTVLSSMMREREREGGGQLSLCTHHFSSSRALFALSGAREAERETRDAVLLSRPSMCESVSASHTPSHRLCLLVSASLAPYFPSVFYLACNASAPAVERSSEGGDTRSLPELCVCDESRCERRTERVRGRGWVREIESEGERAQ